MKQLLVFALLCYSCSAFCLKAQPIFSKLGGIVWSLEFFDKDTGLAALRDGKILFFNLNTKQTTEISGGPLSYETGQGGLLDLALHPEFKSNALVFFTFTKSDDKVTSTTALAVAKFDKEKKLFTELRELFVAQPFYSENYHYGSRIAFDQSGHVFLTVGDRGNRDFAQDLSRHNGKIIRLKLDGSIPKDNPFVERSGARPEIWTYGHRNPQGLVYDDLTATLWAQEHGPKGGDEINRIQKGANYGWPVITYGREYSGPKIGAGITKKPGMEQPQKYFVPSIAPSGLELYQVGPLETLQNSLLSGALKLQHLNQVKIEEGNLTAESRHFESLGERIRDVRQAPDKKLYFSTDSGRIYRVEP